MGKNLQKVQDMLDNNYGGKIQVGVGDQEVEPIRKVGDRWFDSNGKEWEQMNGYRSSIKITPDIGIFSRQCKDCRINCSSKSYDKHTWIRNNRCYKCQTQWEEDLKYEKKNKIGEKGCKWTFWVRLEQLYQMDSIEKEMEQLIFTKHDENYNSGKILDDSVATAIANDNVADTMKINKALTK